MPIRFPPLSLTCQTSKFLIIAMLLLQLISTGEIESTEAFQCKSTIAAFLPWHIPGQVCGWSIDWSWAHNPQIMLWVTVYSCKQIMNCNSVPDSLLHFEALLKYDAFIHPAKKHCRVLSKPQIPKPAIDM